MELLLGHRRHWHFPTPGSASLLSGFPFTSFRNWWRERISKLNLSKFLQLRFNLFLISRAPNFVTKAYIWLLARLYFMCKPGQLKSIRDNLSASMKHRTPSEIDRIARGVRSGMVEHYQEKIFAVLSDVTRLKHYLMSGIPLNGQKRVIEDALKEERGVIIATGHYGAVEFLPPYLAIKGYPTTALVKFTTKRLEEIAVRQATELGLGLIIPRHVRNILREATKALSQNKILVTQCDEIDEWRPDPNRTMEFLGKKTHPDRMLKVLCKKTGAVLLLGLLERDGKGKYNLVLHRVPEEGEIPSNVCTLKLLEKYIYRHPEQWYEWKKYDHIACVN